MSFLQFLEEQTIEIDPDASAAEIIRARKMAEQNPQRAVRDRINKAREDKRRAMSSEDPNKGLEAQLAAAREKVARLEQQLGPKSKVA